MGEQTRIARIYASLRTAHLERFRQLDPSTVIYRDARYDFDPAAGDPAARPRRLGRFATVWHLLTHTYDVVEVNEPAIAWLWGDLLLQVAAVRVRSRLVGIDTAIVTYCIGIMDPADDAAGHRLLPRPLVAILSAPVMKLLVRSMTRISFGTTGSHAMYIRHVGAPALGDRERFFEALPGPCTCLSYDEVDRSTRDVVFVGAFTERKGIRQLMEVWERLELLCPDARLTVLGKGMLQDEVLEWARDRRDVTVELDPPRDRIHQALRTAGYSVLLSQRVGGWREQVGLPIVEALAHGCEVVTTDETGLADWLATHGHLVVGLGTPPAEIAARMANRLRDPRPREDVLADLPETDQRLAADRWLLRAEHQPCTHTTADSVPTAGWHRKGDSNARTKDGIDVLDR